ncbi:MAG: YggS family pyridoxal phosphate-dependent enzyme [Actinomycetota bacterium]
MTVAERYERVLERVAAAAERAGREPTEITVVAIAKTFGAAAVLDALEAGVTDVGENRAREFRDKHAVVGDRARWHFVGHLQTNKVRQVVGGVVLIHSVDRFGLAEAISRRAERLGVVQDVLIEVNVAGEASKHGVEPTRAPALAEEISGLAGIAVRGLMTMPPLAPTPEESRRHFKELAALAAQVGDATELSMGMSGDFEVAIEEGATIVRVGQAIFGPRSQ